MKILIKKWKEQRTTVSSKIFNSSTFTKSFPLKQNQIRSYFPDCENLEKCNAYVDKLKPFFAPTLSLFICDALQHFVYGETSKCYPRLQKWILAVFKFFNLLNKLYDRYRRTDDIEDALQCFTQSSNYDNCALLKHSSQGICREFRNEDFRLSPVNFFDKHNYWVNCHCDLWVDAIFSSRCCFVNVFLNVYS